MGVNKVIYGGNTLIDISDKTVTPETLFEGETAKNAAGEDITGTFTIATEMTEQDSLIARLKTTLQGKAAGSGGISTVSIAVTNNGGFPVYYYTADKVEASVAAGNSETINALNGMLFHRQSSIISCTGDYVKIGTLGVFVVMFFTDGGTFLSEAARGGED